MYCVYLRGALTRLNCSANRATARGSWRWKRGLVRVEAEGLKLGARYRKPKATMSMFSDPNNSYNTLFVVFTIQSSRIARTVCWQP